MGVDGPATPAALYKMISIPEAQDAVLRETHPVGTASVPLHKAVGSVLSESVNARDDLPPFPASIKDGYAVRFADGGGDFEVEFEAVAGTARNTLSPGKVAYIGTGGPVPDGADAVVQIENTEQLPPSDAGSKRVRIVKAAKSVGEDIRPIASDIQAGQLVLEKGELIGAAEVGILATVGAAALQVYRRPTVAVLSTGDEVVEPHTYPLGPGQIRDANRSMLLAACSLAGAETLDLGITRDTVGDVEACFARAIEQGADVLITSGGVSMGDKDFIKPILERKGTVHFGKVKMKPGKPLTFATMDVPNKEGAGARRMLCFGLPGNPVSSIVTFNLVVLPALRKLAGWKEPMLRRVHARTTKDIRLDNERPEYHRVTLEWSDANGGELLANSTGGQISSRLLSMRSANALLELPQDSGVLPSGSVVTALLIADLRSMPYRQFASSQTLK